MEGLWKSSPSFSCARYPGGATDLRHSPQQSSSTQPATQSIFNTAHSTMLNSAYTTMHKKCTLDATCNCMMLGNSHKSEQMTRRNVREQAVLCLRVLWPLPVSHCIVAELAVDVLGRAFRASQCSELLSSLGDSARSQHSRCEVHGLQVQLRMALA